MSEIVPVQITAPGGSKSDKTSLFHSKRIISAPTRISAQGFSGIYVVSMSNVCFPVYGCVSVATGCQAIHVNTLSIKQLGEGWQ